MLSRRHFLRPSYPGQSRETKPADPFPGSYPSKPGEVDEEKLEEFRRAWCLGNEAFRKECLEQMDGKVGENHPGEIRRETAEAKAERLMAEELTRPQWSQQDLAARSKSDPRKLAIAARLRQETTLSIKQIAERLHLGKPKGAKANLYKSLNPASRLTSELQLGL